MSETELQQAQRQHEELIQQMRIDTRINAILAAASLTSLILIVFHINITSKNIFVCIFELD